MQTFVQKSQAFLDHATNWVETTLISYDTLSQVALIMVCCAGAYALVRWLKPLLARSFGSGITYQRMAPVLEPLYMPLVWLFLVAVTFNIVAAFDFPVYLLHTAATLLALWLVMRLASNAINNPDLARLVTGIAWAIAALSIAGLLDPVLKLLDAAAITMGSTRISALIVLTGILTLVAFVWGALFISRIFEHSLSHVPTLTPSAQVLLGKLFKIIFITVAVLMAIASTGIDLTALAVFGGAIGVGIGFGLQKVVSNLISGVILLLDSSIKPGDVVEVGGTYGRINKLAARYTSVIARDGRELLIPNEDMITQPVINWTYSDSQVRRALPVGVSYHADIARAMELILEAAAETDRVLKFPPSNCLIKGFGDNSVDLELRMWIEDPQNGVANVASNVYKKIWEKFQKEKIEIPFPQRDLHIVSAPAFEDPAVQAALLKALGTKASPGE